MKYFTFQPQFHQLIRDGVKRSTIRGKAKVKVGERFALRMWTGKPYRSKMGIIGTAIAVQVCPVSIHIGIGMPMAFIVDGQVLTGERARSLAIQEGFHGAGDMAQWFYDAHRKGMPFKGIMTRWECVLIENNP